MEVWKEFMDYHKNLYSLFTIWENSYLNFEKYIRKLNKLDNAQVLVVLDKEDVAGYSISLIQFYPQSLNEEFMG
ncbi:MAG: hypothetical protein ACFFG0_10750 [Candidatus Thorarchaeota archaeon]